MLKAAASSPTAAAEVELHTRAMLALAGLPAPQQLHGKQRPAQRPAWMPEDALQSAALDRGGSPHGLLPWPCGSEVTCTSLACCQNAAGPGCCSQRLSH